MCILWRRKLYGSYTKSHHWTRRRRNSKKTILFDSKKKTPVDEFMCMLNRCPYTGWGLKSSYRDMRAAVLTLKRIWNEKKRTKRITFIEILFRLNIKKVFFLQPFGLHLIITLCACKQMSKKAISFSLLPIWFKSMRWKWSSWLLVRISFFFFLRMLLSLQCTIHWNISIGTLNGAFDLFEIQTRERFLIRSFLGVQWEEIALGKGKQQNRIESNRNVNFLFLFFSFSQEKYVIYLWIGIFSVHSLLVAIPYSWNPVMNIHKRMSTANDVKHVFARAAIVLLKSGGVFLIAMYLCFWLPSHYIRKLHTYRDAPFSEYRKSCFRR